LVNTKVRATVSIDMARIIDMGTEQGTLELLILKIESDLICVVIGTFLQALRAPV
jgi:hypothetical protein